VKIVWSEDLLSCVLTRGVFRKRSASLVWRGRVWVPTEGHRQGYYAPPEDGWYYVLDGVTDEIYENQQRITLDLGLEKDYRSRDSKRKFWHGTAKLPKARAL
jgi:hypothetical protein